MQKSFWVKVQGQQTIKFWTFLSDALDSQFCTGNLGKKAVCLARINEEIVAEPCSGELRQAGKGRLSGLSRWTVWRCVRCVLCFFRCKHSENYERPCTCKGDGKGRQWLSLKVTFNGASLHSTVTVVLLLLLKDSDSGGKAGKKPTAESQTEVHPEDAAKAWKSTEICSQDTSWNWMSLSDFLSGGGTAKGQSSCESCFPASNDFCPRLSRNPSKSCLVLHLRLLLDLKKIDHCRIPGQPGTKRNYQIRKLLEPLRLAFRQRSVRQATTRSKRKATGDEIRGGKQHHWRSRMHLCTFMV